MFFFLSPPSSRNLIYCSLVYTHPHPIASVPIIVSAFRAAPTKRTSRTRFHTHTPHGSYPFLKKETADKREQKNHQLAAWIFRKHTHKFLLRGLFVSAQHPLISCELSIVSRHQSFKLIFPLVVQHPLAESYLDETTHQDLRWRELRTRPCLKQQATLLTASNSFCRSKFKLLE